MVPKVFDLKTKKIVIPQSFYDSVILRLQESGPGSSARLAFRGIEGKVGNVLRVLDQQFVPKAAVAPANTPGTGILAKTGRVLGRFGKFLFTGKTS